MDKKSLIGLGLIAVILITWLALSGPSKEQIARSKQIKDSVELALTTQQLAEQSKAAADRAKKNDTITPTVLSDSAKQVIASSLYKDFSVATVGKKEVVTIENENIKAFISTKGGNVEKVILKNYQRYGQKEPLILFDKDSTSQYLQFEAYANNIRFTTDSFYFTSSSMSEIASGNGTKSIILKLNTSKPESYIEYIYTLKGNDYMLDYDVNFVGMQNIISARSNKITMHWSQAMPSQEKHIKKEREAATAYYNQVKEGVDYINARKSEEKLLNEDDIKWICFKQHFFNSTLIADSEFLKDGSFIKTSENPNSKEFVKTITAEVGIPFKHSSSEKFGMAYYFGPTQYKALKAYDIDLEKIIPLGWSVFSYINKWMIIPLFSLLSGLNSGIIILILTLIIKTLLFPIAYKTYMSSSKMRVLKPEIDEINAKYEKNDDPMKKQQEQMSLYRRAGANPLSGCLPMLLQFPILIALFGFFPAAIELRQKGFMWTDDLSTYDSVYNFGFEVWGFGDHISLFALLMFASTIIYTWMNQALLQPQQTQMPGMKYMMYLMPVIFLAVMNSYAAGLSWYYFLANIITFLQTWLMKKFIDDGKIREELLANMKKPEKKSGFQAKLEEMAKQRQQLPAKKK
ncbi:MAG: membrane protein insertase YidC [Bacteroidetes bacterium]|nr:membrane protein insertase YidC [Bacteroidota bacterium]